MINVFPDAVLVMWMEPLGPNVTVVERRLYAAARAATPRRCRRSSTPIAWCTTRTSTSVSRVQRSHDAGLDADGVLATVEERGVYFVHQHFARAAGGRGDRS